MVIGGAWRPRGTQGEANGSSSYVNALSLVSPTAAGRHKASALRAAGPDSPQVRALRAPSLVDHDGSDLVREEPAPLS